MSGQQSYVLNDNDLKPYQSMFIRVTHLEKEYDKAREEILLCGAANLNLARKLERERDEAREAAEKAKAYKRVLKEDNAKLRRDLDKAQRDADTFLENFGKTQERAINAERELDELDKRLIEVSQFGVVAAIEREDLRKEVAKLHEIIRSEWPEDQAEELIKQCKTQLN